MSDHDILIEWHKNVYKPTTGQEVLVVGRWIGLEARLGRYHVAYYDHADEMWWTVDHVSDRKAVDVECWAELPNLQQTRHEFAEAQDVLALKMANDFGQIRKQISELEDDNNIVLDFVNVSRSTVNTITYDVFKVKDPRDNRAWWACRPVCSEEEFTFVAFEKAADADIAAVSADVIRSITQ